MYSFCCGFDFTLPVSFTVVFSDSSVGNMTICGNDGGDDAQGRPQVGLERAGQAGQSVGVAHSTQVDSASCEEDCNRRKVWVSIRQRDALEKTCLESGFSQAMTDRVKRTFETLQRRQGINVEDAAGFHDSAPK